MNLKKGLRAVGSDLKKLGEGLASKINEHAEREKEKREVYKDALLDEEKKLLKEKAKIDARKKVFGEEPETKAAKAKKRKLVIGYGNDAKEYEY